jgi:Flp pilus assembly pilin Flp
MPPHSLKRRKRDERGAAAVIFALLSVVLLGVAALGTDVGNMVSRRTETQASADFAAFAAAHELNQTARAGTAPSTDVVEAVRDYLNDNQPQDDELACAQTDPGTCVESADLTDLDLDNGEVRYNDDGLQVVAPRARVDFALAGIFGNQGTYVDGQATVNVFSGGQRVMPMFAVSACDYGRQTLTDPASGHVTPVVPSLAYASDANGTDLDSAVLRNSSGANINEVPRDSTSNTITLKASKWTKTREIGFFRSDNPDPLLVARQEEFWSPSDDPDGPDSDSSARTDLSVDDAPPTTFADTYTTSASAGDVEVKAMIPDIVTQTEGVWWVRVLNGPSPGTWSPTSEAIPIRVGGAVLECTAGSTDGNFGTLRLPRTDVPTGSELPVNIAVGLQQPLTPAIHQWAVDNPTLAGTCSDGVDGAVESFGTTLRPATNCVDTDTGLSANVATQGLITGAGGHPGMLTTRATKYFPASGTDPARGCDPSGGSSDRTVSIASRNYAFNNDVLTCYLTNGTTSLADIASATYSGPPVLDVDIYSAPRFIWIPVLKIQPASGGSQRYSIIDFRPGFITDEQATSTTLRGSHTATSDNGLTFRSNDVEQIKVLFFNVNALPVDGDYPTIDFLGVGTPKIKLID